MNEIQDALRIFAERAKEIVGKELVRIVVYGSYARGDFNKDSDVDVMVLTTLAEDDIKAKEYQLYDAAFDVLMDYLVDISVMLINVDSFEYWLGALPFYDNVKREGIVIAG
jgi:predicted nucleotidyltransferase